MNVTSADLSARREPALLAESQPSGLALGS